MDYYNPGSTWQILFIWIRMKMTVKQVWYRTRDYRFVEEMKSRYPLHNYERTAKIMKELRGIKTALEIEVMQKAIDITNNTFHSAC